MNESELKKKIFKYIKKLVNENKIYLFCSNTGSYHKANEIILKELTKKYKLKGCYITLNTPHPVLECQLIKAGVDISKIYFIDGTGRKNSNSKKADNCKSISSQRSLTELSLAITDITNAKEFNFLFLDSISTLTVYNDSKVTERFTNYIVNKLRNLNLRTIFIVLDDDDESKKLVPIISQFCDECIKLC